MGGRRFCYRCGAGEESGPLIEGLCQRCYSAENPLIRAPAGMRVTVCGDCGAYLAGNVWRRPSERRPESSILDAVLSQVRVAVSGPGGGREVPAWESPLARVDAVLLPGGKRVRIVARGRVHELQRETVEEADVDVEMEERMCGACRLRRSGRYEAIVQVRGKIDAEAMERIRRMVEETVEGAGSSAFVSKVVEHREGPDFYVHPSGVARRIANRIRSAFGGEIKESAKLVGQTSDGRRRYRSTFMVRI